MNGKRLISTKMPTTRASTPQLAPIQSQGDFHRGGRRLSRMLDLNASIYLMPSYCRGSARARSLAALLAGFCWLVLSGTPLAGQPAAPQPDLSQRVQLILRTRFPASGKAPE